MTAFVSCKYSRSFVKRNIILIGALFLNCVFFPASAHTLELPETFQIHGFASQSFILTSDNNIFGNSSDNGSFDFTELGLNVSFRPHPNLQLSAQTLSRHAGKGDDGNVRLDYGLVDYSFISNGSGRTGIRVGRIKNPYGLYNETRDVVFTRPGIFLPQSIYFDRTRNLTLSSDSFHTYSEYRNGSNEIFLQLGALKPKVDDQDTELSAFGADMAGELKDSTSYIGRLLYELYGGKVRMAVSGAQINVKYNPAAVDPVNSGTIRVEPLIFSGQYNEELWSLTFEYSLRFYKYKNFGPSIPDNYFVGESYYLQGIYRIVRNWEAMLRYDVFFLDRDDRDGHKYATKTTNAGQARPHYNRFAKDLTLGLRWHVIPSFMLSAEYHNVDGAGWLPLQDNPDLQNTKRRWHMFAFLAAYRF